MPAASFPGSVKTYTDKIDGVSIVQAVDINSVQAEVNAIETALGTNPASSSLPSAGTYNPNGVSTSLSARITNIEAGLTGDSTDGYRVGYTPLLSTQTLTISTNTTGTITFNSIPAGFQKLVIHLDFTSATVTAGALTMTINDLTTTTYSYAQAQYANATTVYSTNSANFPLGTPTATNNQWVVEIPNYTRATQGKTLSVLGPTTSTTAYQQTAGTITKVVFSIAGVVSGSYTAVAKIYGVK